MPEVGILSMQRIRNYGSFLQAYALKKLLEEAGCDVQFVDYHPGKPLITAREGNGLFRKFNKAIEAFRTGAPFFECLKYIRYKRRFAQKYFPLLGIDDTMNYSPDLDLLVIGSDEVFNCVQSNPNVGYSPELFGADNNAKRVISYAASFGNTTTEKLAFSGKLNEVREYLSKFDDAISVRDKNSADILREMGIPFINHLDPVLTYEFEAEKNTPFEVPAEKYMIVYGYTGRFTREENKAVRAYAKAHGLKIYNIGGIQKCCDRFIDCTPEDVIHYFQHAECVVTDTFHGSILSVITQRPFAAFVRSKGYGNSEKLNDLLERLDLSSRKASAMTAGDVIDKVPVNWQIVDDILKEYRKSAKEYLKRNVL